MLLIFFYHQTLFTLFVLQYSIILTTSQSTSKYHIIEDIQYINESQQKCQQHYGTDLASIHNDDDMTNAISICQSRKPTGDACWIGLIRNRTSPISDTFYWLDGSKWDFGNIHNSWKRGEYPWTNNSVRSGPNPNDLGGNEDCVWMWVNFQYQWADVKCSNSDIKLALCNRANPTLYPSKDPTFNPTFNSIIYPTNIPTSDPTDTPTVSQLQAISTLFTDYISPQNSNNMIMTVVYVLGSCIAVMILIVTVFALKIYMVKIRHSSCHKEQRAADHALQRAGNESDKAIQRPLSLLNEIEGIHKTEEVQIDNKDRNDLFKEMVAINHLNNEREPPQDNNDDDYHLENEGKVNVEASSSDGLDRDSDDMYVKEESKSVDKQEKHDDYIQWNMERTKGNKSKILEKQTLDYYDKQMMKDNIENDPRSEKK